MTNCFINKDGHRVEVLQVGFIAQGGGFSHRLAGDKFFELFSPCPGAAPWRRGRVTADWLPGLAFDCWTNGDLWNGWGMPYFEGERIAQLRLLLPDWKIRFDGEDVYYWSDADGSDGGLVKAGRIDLGGAYAWELGAGVFCWDVVEVDK